MMLTEIGFAVAWRHALLVARLRHAIVQVGHHLNLQVLHHLHAGGIGWTHLVGHIDGGCV